MADMMLFPETWEEFEKQYMMIDKEQIYSNGIEYIPCFRVRQWMEHIENKKKHEANKMAQVAALFGKKLNDRVTVNRNGYKFQVRFTEYGLDALGQWDNPYLYVDTYILNELLTGEAVVEDEH